MAEKFVKNNFLVQGSAVGFRQDQILLPNGKPALREYLVHPGAVAVLPFLDSPRSKPLADCRVVMVEQYRFPVRRYTEELPAGKLDPKESLERCLERELEEETGYRSKKVEHLISFCPTPAFSDEVIHIYWASDLKKGKSHPDEDEFLKVKAEKFGNLLEKVRKGTIKDSKTVVGLLAFAVYFKPAV